MTHHLLVIPAVLSLAVAGCGPQEPPGSVVQVKGPFDDRLTLDQLAYDGRQVTGRVTITSDVSELLELQVLAGFHDADGRLIGTARFTHHLDGAHDHGGAEQESPAAPASTAQPSEEFTIAVPQELRGRARSATVAVPVLVNE